jgi:hypothetical protein
MKKLLFNFLFLGIIPCGFAQKVFTEKTLTDMRQRMIADAPCKIGLHWMFCSKQILRF